MKNDMHTLVNFISCKVHELWEHIKYILLFVFAVFQDVRLVTIGMIGLILANQFTGVWKALTYKKHKSGESFRWKKFNTFYAKVILYNVCIISAHTLELAIFQTNEFWITKGLGSIIGIQELFSTVDNVSIIFNNKLANKFKNFLKSKNF